MAKITINQIAEELNLSRIGMIAADLLLSRIQNQKLPSRYTYVQTTPVFRESTGILHE